MSELTPTQELIKAKRQKNYRSAAPGGYGSVDDDGYRKIDNLELLSASEHASRHQRAKAGYELRAGGWYKPCRGCGAVLPLERFYKRAGALDEDHRRPLCKPCHKNRTVERRRALRAMAGADGGADGDPSFQ